MKVKADFGLALQCPGARKFIPEQVGNLHLVTICREFRHSDQTIKSEHVGTDRRRKNSMGTIFLVFAVVYRDARETRRLNGKALR